MVSKLKETLVNILPDDLWQPKKKEEKNKSSKLPLQYVSLHV
jgi:hypothetical protein